MLTKLIEIHAMCMAYDIRESVTTPGGATGVGVEQLAGTAGYSTAHHPMCRVASREIEGVQMPHVATMTCAYACCRHVLDESEEGDIRWRFLRGSPGVHGRLLDMLASRQYCAKVIIGATVASDGETGLLRLPVTSPEEVQGVWPTS